jgi:hypothetical protein
MRRGAWVEVQRKADDDGLSTKLNENEIAAGQRKANGDERIFQ